MLDIGFRVWYYIDNKRKNIRRKKDMWLILGLILLAVIVYGVLGFILQAVLGFFGVIVPLWVAVAIVFLFGVLIPSGGSK